MKYLYQHNIPGMIKFWKLLERMIEENYVTEENEDDYLVFGIVNYWNIEKIKQEYLRNVSYRKLIVYQLEPLNYNHWWGTEQILNNIRGADEIWDYDLENIEILQKEGFDPKFRPCRYTKSLKRIETVEDPKIDILFYASPTDARVNYFNYICHNKTFEYNCAWMTGINGETLDHFMANSKIILNLSTQYENSRQAQTRIFDALINNKCVISQEVNLNYFGDSLIQFFNADEMRFKIESTLQNNTWKIDNNNIKFNPSLFYNSTKLAIFIYIDQNENWIEEFLYLISELQNQGLYDNVDYIHVSFSNSIKFNMKFYKINRLKYEQTLFTDITNDLYNFAYLNPNYKILLLNNLNKENLNISLDNIKNWQTNIKDLDHNHLIPFSNNSFWINSNIFKNETLMNLANFITKKLK